ncbi:MAG: hypothetical protein ACRDJI_09750 [Actinomycetota bacterium]
MADAAVAPSPSGRRRAFFIVAGVAAALLGLLAFGWISLIVGWFESGDREQHRIHDLTWGVLAGLFMAGGFLVQLRNPERKIAPMQQVAATVVAVVLAVLLAEEFDAFAIIFIVVPGIIIWLHPAREAVLRLGTKVSPILAAIAIVAAIPLAVYAFDQIDIQKLDPPAPPESAPEVVQNEFDHWDEGHWWQMAALSFALPLTGLVAAMKTTGWLITARFAGAGAIIFGLASLLNDDKPSALDTGWALAALLGGIMFIGLAEWESRQGPAPPPAGPD